MMRDLIQMSCQIQTCESQTELGTLMVNLMRQISGFDRGMLDKFYDDFNGEVIAEARADHLETCQGLRFPIGIFLHKRARSCAILPCI